jgi:hypothetical protein
MINTVIANSQTQEFRDAVSTLNRLVPNQKIVS